MFDVVEVIEYCSQRLDFNSLRRVKYYRDEVVKCGGNVLRSLSSTKTKKKAL